MKKILLLLISILCFTGCVTYNATKDAWIVTNVSINSISSHECRYTLKDYSGGTYNTETYIIDEVGKFAVGDTLILVKK